MRLMLLLTLVLSLTSVVHCARILGILPIPSKSHSILQYSVFQMLAERGHEVVVYNGLPPPRPIDNLTYIHVNSSMLDLTNNWTFNEFMEFCKMEYYFGFAANFMWEHGTGLSEDVFQNNKIKELLQSDENFDLVFMEPLVGQESLLVFGHKFKAPVITFQGFGTWSLVNWIAGNSLAISHIPEGISFPFTNKMSFMERTRNFISTVLTVFFYRYDHLPRQQKIMNQYYKDPSAPPIQDMVRDISLILSNSHAAIEYPRPYTPNIIPIGGAHMPAHTTPLPQNIKKFMDDAKEGVIFFSLGTFVPAHVLPNEFLQSLAKAFGKLNKKILWKIELEIPSLPKNVMLTKWVPQPTVLAHPNCVLFITHGGLFSQLETLFAGVPVVAIPFFAEQRYNVKLYEHLGVGVHLDLTTVSEESVYSAVNSVLSDPRYAENAKKMSRIFRDKPLFPANSAVFWVEYVLRHKGAPHLRPASADLSWYQLTLADVLVAILAVAVVAFALLCVLIKYLLKTVLGRNSSSVSSNKKIN